MGIEENDKFWSGEELLPPVKKSGIFVPESNDTGTVMIDIGEEENSGSGKTQLRYPPVNIFSEKGEKPDFDKWLRERDRYFEEKRKGGTVKEYIPENPLIKKVSIAIPSLFSPSSERFVRDGEKLFERSGVFKGNVNYRSVYPQYAQLNEEQLECYIGFRSEVRSGKYPEVDEAYKYLYLYELINLTGKMSPAERADGIAGMICGYSECSETMMKNMCSWLGDICLLYRTAVPGKIFGDPEVYRRVRECAGIPEIFLEPDISQESAVAKVIAGTGGYDYRKSKYYQEYREKYDKYIDKTVVSVISNLLDSDPKMKEQLRQTCKLSRESFYGAYRTSAVKRIITGEYVFVSRSAYIKRTVSDITRYTENCLRSRMGIRQSLTVSGIGSEIKSEIKRMIEELTVGEQFTQTGKVKNIKIQTVPDYEKMYMPVSEKFTPEKGGEIEASSWQITERLVTAFEDDAEPDNTEKTGNGHLSEQTDEKTDVFGNVWLRALRAVQNGARSEYGALCKSADMMEDAMADRINEKLSEIIGDVAVVKNGDFYEISEWYTEEIKRLTDGIQEE